MRSVGRVGAAVSILQPDKLARLLKAEWDPVGGRDHRDVPILARVRLDDVSGERLRHGGHRLAELIQRNVAVSCHSTSPVATEPVGWPPAMIASFPYGHRAVLPGDRPQADLGHAQIPCPVPAPALGEQQRVVASSVDDIRRTGVADRLSPSVAAFEGLRPPEAS